MMASGVLERRPGHINIREARRNHLPANRSLTLAYTLSGVAAILLFVPSVAGLVFGQRGFYRPDPATMPALLGQDALSLIVGLPLLLGSMILARRGSLADCCCGWRLSSTTHILMPFTRSVPSSTRFTGRTSP